MKKYYLFTIKKEYFGIYSKNPLALYKTLENLYRLKESDISFGLSLYKQICNIIDVPRLQNYFTQVSKEKRKNKYLIVLEKEKIIFKLRYSCIVCYTSKRIPRGFSVLNYYDKYIFACDFDNENYFFLNNELIKSNINKYNYA